MGYQHHGPEDIERGLTALILAGSSLQASEACGIPSRTLREWKTEHADKYERLQKDLEPRIVDKIAAEAESIVIELADIQRGYAQRMRDTMDELKPGEIPGAMRNAATAAALNVDKLSSPLRERPSHVNQGTDIEGLLQRMARAMGVQHVENEAAIESSAVALPPARASANAHDVEPDTSELEHPPSPA